MAEREYHVDSTSDGRWHIRRENEEKPFAYYRNQAGAESAARVLAHQNEGLVVIHESGGHVRRTDHRGQPVGA